MRELASVRTIKELHPIPKADFIELAIVDGWQCVVKKGEFVVGDKCVYFEIDSVLPDVEWSEFMRSRRFRVKTAKFMKQLAQGLALPMSILGDRSFSAVGVDVTEYLGVTLFQSKAELKEIAEAKGRRGTKGKHQWLLRFALGRMLHSKLYPATSGGWPEYIPKTDERRVQNIRSLEKDNEGRLLYHTEKLDGQSVTFFYNSSVKTGLFATGLYGTCSRNIWYKNENATGNWCAMGQQLQIKMRLENYCKSEGRSIAIQGEIIGEGIQGNYYQVHGKRCYFFNAFDIDTQKYLGFTAKQELFAILGLEQVPNLGTIDNTEDITGYLVIADEESMLIDKGREGIVVRDIKDDSYSFKAISNAWLLAEKG